ncbi:ras-like GTP-binding protein Rho1 [Branchiostoma floridae x Branchiostoma belcheri]|nr:hypothetical protein Bbelb_147140 [Branchiostoma belcheri]
MYDNNGPTITPSPRGKEKPFVRCKLVVVGDGGCGKTCMLMVYCRKEFPKVYVPTVFDNYKTRVDLGSKLVELNLWDTAGQEDYDRLRPLSYNDADVIIICFDVSSQASFENVEVRWAPEIRHFCKGIPIFLIACKSDLRNDRNTLQQLAYRGQEPVSYEQGMALAKRIRARGYMECSARYGENLDHVFLTAAKTAANVQTRRHRKINCTLL